MSRSAVVAAPRSRFSDPSGLSGFAWLVLAYNLAVIVWGAYVRSSGSGAGCGSHWPLCNGQVVPLASGVKTWVEFAHRASSGGSLLLAALLGYWGHCAFPAKHPARAAAARVVLFTISEALIGAFIVLLGLVAQNQSLTRAVSISLHYTNTLLLLASLAQTAWRARAEQRYRPRAVRWSAAGAWRVALAGVVLTGAMGAVTALGDTLYPAASLASGIKGELAAGAPRLLALRIYHPILAVGLATYLIWFLDARLGLRFDDRLGRRLKAALQGAVVFQLILGATNVILLAPTAIQLVHLATAQVVWILLISLRERVQL
jgi:heme A synthase